MNASVEFDEIRPYHDEELPQVYEELIADEAFRQAVEAVMPGVPIEVWSQKMRACKTKLEFQKTFCYRLLWKLAKEATDGLTLEHTALPVDKSVAYTYISNHRDIILDSGFLSILLVDQGMDTVEIAIGDNLLIYPWIKKFVRVDHAPDAGGFRTHVPLYALYHWREETVHLDCTARRACQGLQRPYAG